MLKKIRDSLFAARWGLNKAIDEQDFSKLDYSMDMIIQAKADIITGDIKEPEKKSDFEALVEAYKNSRIPDHFRVASMAQWILESGRGTSDLSKHHNYGGLKWRKEMEGIATRLAIKVPSENKVVEFCAFKSVEDFIEGYWIFIGRSPYKGWEKETDAEGYLDHIAKAGYAADPKYFRKVKSLFVEAHDLLNLEDEPERPNVPVDDEDDQKYHEPKIVVVKGVRFKKRGKYRTKSGMAKGMVVHYTVSGRSKQNAINVLRYLARKGLGCPVMDEKGVIYIPEDFDILRDYAYHAGKSTWKGKSGISAYCIGMEICCWGKDSKKRGGPYRYFDGAGVQDKGHYEEYTTEQEAELRNFVLWLKAVNPEFSIDWLVGHDEIAPSRKADPGGSLSVTMPEYRKTFR